MKPNVQSLASSLGPGDVSLLFFSLKAAAEVTTLSAPVLRSPTAEALWRLWTKLGGHGAGEQGCLWLEFLIPPVKFV